MSKKKVAKQLGLTAAVAASAVVAANPASAASASTVETAVVQAEKDAIALGKFYRNADLEVSADFSAAYNKAKKSIESAKAQVATLTGSQKSLLSARVAAADANRLKAAYYIDGVKFVQNDLAEATAALAEHVEAGEITDETVEVYNNLSATIRKAERVIGKIYGSEVREALQSSYLLDAKFAREAVIYEVSQYELMNEIAEQVAAGELTTAADNFKVLERLKVRAVEIKEDGRALYPDRSDVYPDLPSIETQLRTAETAVTASYQAALTPAVESVSVVNAKQLEIKFNKSIKASTVVAGATSGTEVKDTLLNGALTVSSLDGHAVVINSAKAVLSEDGKSLVLTAQNSEVFSGRYDVAVAAGAIKSTDNKDIAKYSATITAEDKVAPSIVATEQVSANEVKVKFSEPLSALGNVSFKLADGTSVAANTSAGVSYTFTPGSTEVVFTLGTAVGANKSVNATFVGTQDYAGNLITPNPATATLNKGANDGVAPVVTDVTVVNSKKFEVKFSEALLSNPTVTVAGSATGLTVTKSTTDSTKYVVESTTAITGLKTVAVSSFSDLSGEAGTAYSKVVNFSVDTTAPTLASAQVVNVNSAEYLEVAFNEDVDVLAALDTLAITGTKVKDYVTNNVSLSNLPVAKFVAVEGNAKAFRIKLTDLLSSDDVEGAVYNLTLTGKDSTSANTAIVEDKSGNDSATSFKATFTRGKDGTPASNAKATIDTTVDTNGIAIVDTNTLTVGFNQELDGATATDAANYQVAGAVVEKVTLNPASGGKQTVTLHLKADSNTFTGLRNITISGVKAKNGLVMDAYTTAEYLTENVAPLVSSAKLTSPSVITLTFNENVYNAATGSDVDFDLYVGTTKVTAATLDTEDVASGAAKGTLTLTVSGYTLTAQDLATGLTVKAVDATDIKDANGNKFVAGTTLTVQQ